MGNGDGEFPSLADTIAAVRRELSSAQTAGQGQPVQFRTGPVFRAVERGHGDGVSVAGCVVRGLSGGLVLRGLVDGVTVAV